MATATQENDAYVRTEFLGRLAHDLLGRAGVVLGALEQLESDNLDKNAHHAATQMARRSILKLLNLGEKLQFTAELERGSFTLTTEPLDLATVTEAAMSRSAALFPRKTIASKLHCASRPKISGSAKWLEACVVELICNALKFAKSQVDVRVFETPERVCLEIVDDGPGLKEFQSTRFVKTSSRTGTGLSLPLIHDVVLRHGANLVLQQSSDATATPGTCIVVEFPHLGS